jgi:hypothetical protein
LLAWLIQRSFSCQRSSSWPERWVFKHAKWFIDASSSAMGPNQHLQHSLSCTWLIPRESVDCSNGLFEFLPFCLTLRALDMRRRAAPELCPGQLDCAITSGAVNPLYNWSFPPPSVMD